MLKPNKNSAGAVIIGGDFQGLGVIRSLAENDIPIFLVEYELSIARYSRYAKRREKNFSFLHDGSFADYLVDLAKRENLEGWVLFPNNDETVKLLSLNHDKLNDWYRNPVPGWDVVQNFYIKRNAYEVAERAGIPIPRLYRGKCLEELLDQELQFPIVLKPCFKEGYYSKTKKKAIKVKDREEFIKEYNNMASIIPSNDIVVQEMILGGPKNLFSYVAFFDGKKVVGGMSARRIRQHPMDFGHATTFAESVNVPELEALALKFLDAIKYFGLAEVEFMFDNRDQSYKFIEMNGRPWGWHTLAKAAGVNLPYMLFQYVIGKQIINGKPAE
jgi:D-aspartate ligase